MLRQIKLLVGLQQCNVFGINEMRHTKDTNKRCRMAGLCIVWAALFVMLAFYIGAMSVGFVKLKLTSVIPVYLYTICGIVILFFAALKAGSVMFDGRSYEMQISLPVSKMAIIISRFLHMYIENLMLSLCVMLPGMVVYVINVHPVWQFYGYAISGIILLPLFPLTLATAFGAFVAAVSAKMRHKSLVSAGLSLLLIFVMLVASSVINSKTEFLTQDAIKNIASVATQRMGQMYPPARWFWECSVNQNAVGFLKLAVLSIGSFVVLFAVLCKFFVQICLALHASTAKNNYKMQSLTTGSALKALWKRELKRYFSSSIYVSNTVMSYFLMAAFAIILWVVGFDKITQQLPFPKEILRRFLPFVLSFPAVIMPVTACAISMEGKQWWLLQTLPVTSKTIFTSKILTNLTVATPFYVVTVVFALLSVKMNLCEALGMGLVPAAYIIFSAVSGLMINIRFPCLEWENDVQVVKQSASPLFSMLTGFVSVLVPCVLLAVLPEMLRMCVLPVTVVVLLVLSAILFARSIKIKLAGIAQN